MDFERVLDAFAAHQQARGLSTKTIRRRYYALRKLAEFAEPVALLDVSPELIEDWIILYRNPETKCAYLADVRALFKWAKRRRLCTTDPTAELDPVRRPQTLPRPIPRDELGIALAGANAKIRLILLLGALAGLRRFEIASLRAEDVTAQHVVIRDGKGAKSRVVPTHPLLWDSFQLHGVRHGWVFESPVTGGHIHSGTVGNWVRAHFDALDIDRTLHATRHFFGTHLAEISHGNLLAVKELMGHARVSTTEGYTAFDRSGLAALVEQLEAG